MHVPHVEQYSSTWTRSTAVQQYGSKCTYSSIARTAVDVQHVQHVHVHAAQQYMYSTCCMCTARTTATWEAQVQQWHEQDTAAGDTDALC